MPSHRELARTIPATGPEMVAIVKVDRWVVRHGGDASSGWEFLHRRQVNVTRITPKRVYCGSANVFPEVYDRRSGQRIARRDLRIGSSYHYELELVKLAEKHGGEEVFRTEAGKAVASGS